MRLNLENPSLSLRNLSVYFTVFLFFGVSPCTFSQQFNFQTYSVSEGLGQSQVYALLEDQNGYLWMGTQGGGISRFDGQRFQSFTTRDSLKDNFVFSILQRKNGDLLVGSKTGLSVFDKEKFRWLFPELRSSINDLVEDENGRVWIGTSSGIYRIEKQDGRDTLVNFSQVNQLSSPRIYRLFQGQKGVIWAGTTIGLYKITEDKIQLFSTKNGLPANDVTAVLETKGGQVLLGIFGKGVYQLLDHKIVPLSTKTPIKATNFWSFMQRKKGEIWLGSLGAGVFVWQPQDSTTLQLDERKGLSKNDVRCLTEDRWGEVWVGTSGGGVSRYSGQQFTHFDREKGLGEEYIYAVETDTAGRIWFAEYDNGVRIFENGQFVDVAQDSVPFSFEARAIYQAKNGEIWVGTEEKGLVIFAKDTIKYVGADAGLPTVQIRAITEDLNGRILVGTTGEGIFRIFPTADYRSGYEIEQFTTKNGLSDNRINDLFVDKWNRIWYAGRWHGIGVLPPNQPPQYFSQKDGLPSNEVRSIVVDSSGLLWLGTNAGLAKMPIYQDTLRFLEAEDNTKLTSKNTYLLKFDRENNLWIGSQKGVEKAILDAERNIQKTQFFGRVEGFVGIETCQNAVTQDSLGNLWFGTMGGLTKYVPGTSISNSIPPVLRLTDVRLFYESLTKTSYAEKFSLDTTQNSILSFQPNDNHLAFSFLGINLPNPEKVVYQWRLADAETVWSPISPQNQVTYTNLEPGAYTFFVKAANEDLVWSTPVRFSFEIRPHFWQTAWFKIAVPSALLLLIGLIFKIRLNQIKAKANQERERLEMEKHLLELEQKALQLQMNPHFIFNALNTIQSQISERDHQTARYQLAKFSKLMRAILENSRTSKISLETEIETLTNYLNLEKFSRGHTFIFSIETDLEEEADDIEIPPMLIQPFVENAIIHGVAHLRDRKGEIKLFFTQQKERLVCKIQDNGVGREQAKLLKSQIEEQHRSVAMEVTRERLEALDGVNKALIINDLEGGTEVILNIQI